VSHGWEASCTLILLYLFNPVVTSLRGLQQASELEKVQKKLGCKRSALGSLSEAASVFDPERLKEIIEELGEDLEPLGRAPRLQDFQGLLTIVDGTLLAGSPDPSRRGSHHAAYEAWQVSRRFHGPQADAADVRDDLLLRLREKPARTNCSRTSGSCRCSLPIHECCADTDRLKPVLPLTG
jgi:hypothetical protein